MVTFLYVLFIIACSGLTVSILLQSSKGGGLAGAFGGGGGDMGAVFGGRGAATFLSRMTSGLATAFLLLSLVLSLVNRGETGDGSLVKQEQQKRSSVPASVPIVPTQETQGLIPAQIPTQDAAAPVDSTR